jgi:hypothetical protein
MKWITVGLALFAGVALPSQCFSQGFVNLDFEQANVPPTAANSHPILLQVDPASAFPGWTLGQSTNNYQLFVLYNSTTLDSTAVILVGPEFPNSLNLLAMQGSYSVILRYSFFFQSSPFISQAGLVPDDAKSISLDISQGFFIDLSLNGVAVPLFEQPNGRFAGDVSAFAGQTATLKISGSAYIDDIAFSPSTIPEPATFVLLVPGTFLIGFWRHRQKPSAPTTVIKPA